MLTKLSREGPEGQAPGGTLGLLVVPRPGAHRPPSPSGDGPKVGSSPRYSLCCDDDCVQASDVGGPGPFELGLKKGGGAEGRRGALRSPCKLYANGRHMLGLHGVFFLASFPVGSEPALTSITHSQFQGKASLAVG
jgi:hypothetical protein